jgi:hypothetical protein
LTFAGKCLLPLFLISGFVFSQQPAGTNQQVSAVPETIIVTGTFEPIPLSEANRSVLSFDTQDEPLLYNSFVDYLQLDPSILDCPSPALTIPGPGMIQQYVAG